MRLGLPTAYPTRIPCQESGIWTWCAPPADWDTGPAGRGPTLSRSPRRSSSTTTAAVGSPCGQPAPPPPEAEQCRWGVGIGQDHAAVVPQGNSYRDVGSPPLQRDLPVRDSKESGVDRGKLYEISRKQNGPRRIEEPPWKQKASTSSGAAAHKNLAPPFTPRDRLPVRRSCPASGSGYRRSPSPTVLFCCLHAYGAGG